MKYFGNYNLKIEVLQSIKNMNIVNPTPIQDRCIPLILEHRDVCGIGQTGTGKTLAYGASMISMFTKDNILKGLILAPTRELVLQIEKEMKKLTVCAPMRVVSVFGGTQIEKQISELKRGVDILVATPGRLLDLMDRHLVDFDQLQMVVIDEADEMLKMGFIEDVDKILEAMPENKQMLLFSATMKAPIRKLLNTYMKEDHDFIQIDPTVRTAETVKQYYCEVRNKDKLETLCRLIDCYHIQKGLVFCLTKKAVDDLSWALRKKGYTVEAIHGDLTQEQRFQSFSRFKNNQSRLLVATDVMARGIDIKEIDYVINYEVGKDKDSYVHRIGRTGRAQNEGIAISLVTYKEKEILENIAKAMDAYIQKLNVPSNEEIHKAVTTDILKEASVLFEKRKHLDSMDILKQYDSKNLLNLASCMLTMLYEERIGFDSSIKITNESEYVKIRILAGESDRISYTNMKKAILSNVVMPEEMIGRIQIERKYTIIEIHQDYADEVIKKLTNLKVNRIRLKLSKMGD